MNWKHEAWIYIKPLWENRQNQISLRAVLAIAFSIHFMFIDRTASETTLLAIGGLITAFLGITAFQNIRDKQTETDLQKTVVKTSSSTTGGDMDDPDVQIKTVNIKK